MTNRLFVSLDFPEPVLKEIINIRQSIYDDPNLRWEPISKLHLTLKFLGDVNTDLIDSILSSLKKTAEVCEKVESSFSKFGLFYKFNKPAILWLGIEKNDQLNFLFNKVNENINRIGFKPEKRSFKPHLTLLRMRGKEDLKKIKNLTDFNLHNLKFTASQISLIKSELKPGGSVYENLQSFYLI